MAQPTGSDEIDGGYSDMYTPGYAHLLQRVDRTGLPSNNYRIVVDASEKTLEQLSLLTNNPVDLEQLIIVGSVPSMYNAERKFGEAFGYDWHKKTNSKPEWFWYTEKEDIKTKFKKIIEDLEEE